MAEVALKGYIQVARWRGVPILLHWSTLLGMTLFTGFKFHPGAWLGFVLLIVVHELGHAFVVQRARARVKYVDVHALGGTCHWEGEVSPIQRACIAWGGVWAQLVLLAATGAVLALDGPPEGAVTAQLASVFTRTNLFVLLFNLVPVAPLDGAQAWPLVPLWWRRSAQRRAQRRRRAAEAATSQELARRDALEAEQGEAPEEVKAGIQALLTSLKDEERGAGRK